MRTCSWVNRRGEKKEVSKNWLALVLKLCWNVCRVCMLVSICLFSITCAGRKKWQCVKWFVRMAKRKRCALVGCAGEQRPCSPFLKRDIWEIWVIWKPPTWEQLTVAQWEAEFPCFLLDWEMQETKYLSCLLHSHSHHQDGFSKEVRDK